MEVSNKFYKKHPYLSRDNESKILSMIQKVTEKFWLISAIDFVDDSLFCEFCYVIDLDKKSFEVFAGFNTSPLRKDERFYKENFTSRNDYQPVKFLISYDLNNLPKTDKFLNDIDKIMGVEDT